MDNLFNLIGNNALLINVVALILYQFLKPEKTPFSATLFAVIAIGVVHIFYQGFLESFYGIEEYKTTIRRAWYLGFALSDIILVIVSLKYCKRKQLVIDKVTRFILISYMAHGGNHLIRFMDRFWLETDFFKHVYPNIVLTLTVGISVVVISHVSFQFFKEIQATVKRED